MLAFTFLGDGPKNSVEIERTNEVKGKGDCSDPFGNIITTITTKKNMSRLGSHIVTPYQATLDLMSQFNGNLFAEILQVFLSKIT